MSNLIAVKLLAWPNIARKLTLTAITLSNIKSRASASKIQWLILLEIWGVKSGMLVLDFIIEAPIVLIRDATLLVEWGLRQVLLLIDSFSDLLKWLFKRMLSLAWFCTWLINAHVFIVVTLCKHLSCSWIYAITFVNLSLLRINLPFEALCDLVIFILNCQSFHLLILLELSSLISEKNDRVPQHNQPIKVILISCCLLLGQ